MSVLRGNNPHTGRPLPAVQERPARDRRPPAGRPVGARGPFIALFSVCTALAAAGGAFVLTGLAFPPCGFKVVTGVG
jgi:hypothetical protein